MKSVMFQFVRMMKPILAIGVVVFIGAIDLNAQVKRDGDAPYIPTKLEWAALELQASNGSTIMTRETPLQIAFWAASDGSTIRCALVYSADYEAAALKIHKDGIERAFQRYRDTRGWKWLKLQFHEEALKQSWPR